MSEEFAVCQNCVYYSYGTNMMTGRDEETCEREKRNGTTHPDGTCRYYKENTELNKLSVEVGRLREQVQQHERWLEKISSRLILKEDI